MTDIEWDGFPENPTETGWHWIDGRPWLWDYCLENECFVWFESEYGDSYRLNYIANKSYGGPCRNDEDLCEAGREGYLFGLEHAAIRAEQEPEYPNATLDDPLAKTMVENPLVALRAAAGHVKSCIAQGIRELKEDVK